MKTNEWNAIIIHVLGHHLPLAALKMYMCYS